jgi:phage tail sheath protein FI
MPTTPTYPGVYIEEVPSGVRTIAGVATSIAAFVGYFRQGPMNEATQIFSMADFNRKFGGLDRASEASYAIQQFFLNGGSEAWVVRTASGSPAAATVEIQNEAGGTALTVTAASPGRWGDSLRVIVDYPEPTPGDRFNLSILLVRPVGGTTQVVQTEDFKGLRMSTVETVVNDRIGGSKLVRVVANGNDRPRQTGTVSGTLPAAIALGAALTPTTPAVNVTIGTAGTATARLTSLPTTPAAVRTALEAAIRAALPASRAFAEAAVRLVDGRLRVLAGPTEPDARVTFAAAGPDPAFLDLGLDAAVELEGLLSAAIGFPVTGDSDLHVTIGATTHTVTVNGPMIDLAAARAELEAAIRGADPGDPAFAAAHVAAHEEGGVERLIVLAGVSDDAVSFAEGPGSVAGDLGLVGGGETTIVGTFSGDVTPVPNLPAGSNLEVTIGADGPHAASTAAAAGTLAALADQLQAALRGANAGATAFDAVLVAAYEDAGANHLVALTAGASDSVVFTAAPTDAGTVTDLLLDDPTAFANVQSYRLGGGAVASTAQAGGQAGDDGEPTRAAELIGDPNLKTGLHALEDVDLFNLLSIPRASQVEGDHPLDPDPVTAQAAAVAVMTAAINYATRRRALFLVDPPNHVDDPQGIKGWLDANNGLRQPNAALYYPEVEIPDPLDDFRLRRVAPSGTIAGLCARTDGSRGVWKAPAGTEAKLTNVQRLAYRLTDAENGLLNPLAINALRNFPVTGRVAWGARTLVGADDTPSDWKYVPVRRLALFLEESLFRGTQWVVFEPNDEPLWAQIRLNVGAFLQSLFLQGAFQGTTPRQAYLVKCDRETTTQDDVNRGIVNILVGFAPLKPAEFVIIRIQQLAGQTS